MPVIDASVLVASLHRGEAGNQASIAFLRACAADNVALVTPAIAIPEVASAVSRGGDQALARRAVRSLLNSRIVRVRDVGPRLAELSGEVATDHGLRGCDAVYVGLALLTDQRLVTWDRDQLERGRGAIEVVEPGT